MNPIVSMRHSITTKVLVVFSTLALLSLFMAVWVYVALHNFVALKKDLDTVRQFQQQTAALVYLEGELVLRHQPPTDRRLSDTFAQVEKLAAQTDLLVAKHELAGRIGATGILERIEQYRNNNLELFQLYRKKASLLDRDQELWQVLSHRIRVLPQGLRLRLDPLLSDTLVHQLRRGSPGQGDLGLAEIRRLAEELEGAVDDPAMGVAMTTLLENIQEDSAVRQAMAEKERLLADTAADFEGLIHLAVSAVSSEIMAQRLRMGQTIIALSLLLVTAIVMAWYLVARYCRQFLAGIRFAVSSIRSGDFDFPLPAVSQDEFGDQIVFVKEMGLSLKENLCRLADSEKRFRAMVENISDWIWVVDAKNICVYSSPQCREMLGVGHEQACGRSLEDLVGHGTSSGDGGDSLQKRMKDNLSFDGHVHWVVGRDGGWRELETSGRPVTDGEGRFQGYRFISRDVSARRKAEKAFRQNVLFQEFYNKILGLSLQDLGLDEILGRFLELVLSSSWLRLEAAGALFLVREAGGALEMRVQKGMNTNVQISCVHVPFGVCLCGQAAQTGKVVFCDTVDERHEITHEGMHLHGHYCVPIHSVAGEVLGVFTVYVKEETARDPRVESALNDAATVLGGIIKRRRAEEKLQTLNLSLEEQVAERTAQLTAANKELDTFAYSVSHDLRAPLRAINGFSQALLEDCHGLLNEEGRGYLDRVRKGCVTMGKLIDDILQLSRLTRGEIRRKRVDLSATASEVLEVLQQGDRSRRLEWVIEPGLSVEADPVMMRAVLDNLLGNAWKYTAKTEKARIEVSGEEENGRMVYRVRDNGVGFDMRYQEKLFAAFQRLHSPAEFEGSGVGLATVQRIIHRHGGEIWAESVEGQGASFYFTL